MNIQYRNYQFREFQIDENQFYQLKHSLNEGYDIIPPDETKNDFSFKFIKYGLLFFLVTYIFLRTELFYTIISTLNLAYPNDIKIFFLIAFVLFFLINLTDIVSLPFWLTYKSKRTSFFNKLVSDISNSNSYNEYLQKSRMKN